MSEVESSVQEIIGEVHILFRGDDQVEIQSTLTESDLNWALDQVKLRLLMGELSAATA